ncbi:MAG: nickel pincer cofactor biosynthesis protein LarC [Deltaproteobacteria bacterium]|nr:nickel pincer cofactor biosynthesis protein LarC [Deltaproteobacteria bacterium]
MKDGKVKIAYFDCCSGISGDMVVGALIDSGLDIKILQRELKKLAIKDYSVSASRDERHNIVGSNFKIRFKESSHHRTFTGIKNLINKSKLSAKVKALSAAIFLNLAKAEAKVHECNINDIHFHEVGAVDSIADIVGTAIGIEQLGIEKIYSSPLPLGSGWVETSHGRMPVPAPATLELLKDVPVVSSPVASELTTPTGAAIIKTLAQDFGNMPNMTIQGTGCGVGDKNFKEIPNILRLVIGEGLASNGGRHGHEKLLMIETNIDDMNPQIYDYLMARLFKKDALDVFLIPIQMKKGRPAILLNVLCSENKQNPIIDVIFKETTTLGIRTYEVNRYCLERKTEDVSTPYGKVRVKVSQKDGKLINIQSEYEDCKKIAEKKNVPLKQVMDVAKEAGYNLRQRR